MPTTPDQPTPDKPDQPTPTDRLDQPTPPDPGYPGRGDDVPPPPPPPRRLTVTERRASLWTAPTGAAPLPLLVGVLLLAVAAAATLPVSPPGVDVPALAAAAVALIVWTAPRRRDVSGWAFLVLALALSGVAALRDSPWLVWMCLAAAVCLASAAALRARSWPALVLSVPVVAVAWLFGGAWLLAAVRWERRPRATAPWLRGAAMAGVLALVIGGLLAWADPVFAVTITGLWPTVQLSDAQAITAVATACLVTALVYGAASGPRWERLARAPRSRPAAEWALPLAVVDAVLLAFGAVQAAVLFDRYSPSLAWAGVTYADRAREGFGQLVAVTLLTLALLGWAGRRADRSDARHRRLLSGTGGLLVVLSLGVVVSALRRMWFYEEAYGWTVLRLCVGTFELWLGGVLVLVAVAWAVRRTVFVPRLVVASAATVLLGLGVAGPDAVVASWNVDRFERIEKIDVQYLSRLSADAVPALACLQEPLRQQALAGRSIQADPWYALNLARTRANAALRVTASTSSAASC